MSLWFGLRQEMNLARKIKRNRTLRQKKTKAKLTLRGFLLFIGISFVLLGFLCYFVSSYTYLLGMQEHTSETPIGPIYHPEEAPGNPGWKESGYAGFAIAGVGVFLMLISLLLSFINKQLKLSENSMMR